MNKKLLSFVALLLFGFVGIVTADLIRGAGGWTYTAIATSGSVVTGAGELGGVYLSSGIQTTVSGYTVVYDTDATTSLEFAVSNTAANRMTPALVFQSSATVTQANATPATQMFPFEFRTTLTLIDSDGNGVRFNRGLYYLPSTNGASGEANRAVIKWRRTKE